MGKSQDNLKAAFAGESEANQTYHAFAKKAGNEGYKMVARLFRAAAAAETVHAQNHMAAMEGVGESLDNVKKAMAGEAHEFKAMYPEFLQVAQEEEQQGAARSFEYALKVEQVHHALYSKAAERLEKDKDLSYHNIFVCRGCGNTVLDSAPEKCPICNAPKSWFMWVE